MNRIELYRSEAVRAARSAQKTRLMALNTSDTDKRLQGLSDAASKAWWATRCLDAMRIEIEIAILEARSPC